MTFFELVNKRESCRSYKNVPVEHDKIIACIEAARLAPSACNSQPWHFVVVDDREKARELSPLLQDKVININKYTINVPLFIVVVEGNANLLSKFGGRFKDQEYAKIDIGIAAEHICLAATEQGLGSCILGWFD
jgi:nitroreductase